LQAAVAFGLQMPDLYFAELKAKLAARRDFLIAGLRDIGFDARPAPGAYFAMAAFAGLDPEGDDLAFCRRLTVEAGVTAVPLSAFYSGREKRGHIRFCFAKTSATLEAAIARLAAWRKAKF
jgi:aspartate/methionine/tyrosine aminotransferase